jgi:hypothetical protein
MTEPQSLAECNENTAQLLSQASVALRELPGEKIPKYLSFSRAADSLTFTEGVFGRRRIPSFTVENISVEPRVTFAKRYIPRKKRGVVQAHPASAVFEDLQDLNMVLGPLVMLYQTFLTESAHKGGG